MAQLARFLSRFADLYRAPKVNPINSKARSIPALNPFNKYGRVFFFSWFGFMVAFWAWYTFPPLLSGTIKADLHLTPAQIANSNIVSICAALLIRIVSGTLCDMYGPRKVFAGLLALGAVPVGLAPLVKNASGLYAARFFIGLLGGTFVPCQVWTTAFFDKNVVGTANALTGGLGNAGGGVTYFIMPAVFDSIYRQLGGSHDQRAHQAWRITFVVPLVVVLATALALLLLCPDTPTGPWDEREMHTPDELRNPIVLQLAQAASKPPPANAAELPPPGSGAVGANNDNGNNNNSDAETLSSQYAAEPKKLAAARAEIVVSPNVEEVRSVFLSLSTWALMLTYMCSFGTELVVDGILSTYYRANFPELSQTKAAAWAAMFGFLNVVTRPLGGIAGDLLYRRGSSRSHSHGNSRRNSAQAAEERVVPLDGSFRRPPSRRLWHKKALIAVCGILSGVLLIVIGLVNPRAGPDGKGVPNRHAKPTMFGLIALFAIFLEAGNGANFALVPHVHPFANGVVSGLTGAAGNFGGIIFSILFRFTLTSTGAEDMARTFWIMGIIHIAVNLAVAWIPPIPSKQIGGR